MCANIRQKAYPVVEKSGILFAYMGPGEPPAFPHFDCFVAPASHTFAFKGMIDCNWLQSLEVGIDPGAHLVPASLLPRRGAGQRLRQAVPRQVDQLRHADDADHARVPAPADRGRADRLRHARRHAAPDQRRQHACARHQSGVPARLHHPDEQRDDDHAMARADRRHAGTTGTRSSPASARRWTRTRCAASGSQLYELPDYVPRKNKSNDYGFDPHEQEHETFTGMGADINVHDQWACESMGAIQDRTHEHLGQSDKAISAYRRLLRARSRRAGNGGRPLMVLDARRRDRSPARRRSTASVRRMTGRLLAQDRRGRGAVRQAGQRRSSYAGARQGASKTRAQTR